MKKLEDTGKGSQKAMEQHAALCFRTDGKGNLKVLLITSRDTGRWVMPKGWPMLGLTGGETALREAFEEAGVVGRLEGGPIGLYSYPKILDGGEIQPCVVSIHPVATETLRSDYPEKDQRTRRWFSPRKAARRVAEPELAEVLSAFVPPRPDLSAQGHA